MIASRPVATFPVGVLSSTLGFGALAAGLGGWFALRAWRAARLIASTPPTALSALTAGLHEVQGSIHGSHTLTSPLAQRACLYWRLLVEQRRQNNWETLVDRKESVTTWLDDGGGRVELAVQEADVILTRSEHVSGGIFGVPSAELTDLLARLAEAPPNLQGPYVRYREECFVQGDRLHSIGTVVESEGSWRMRPEGDVFVLSDRDEAEVVRYEERMALRWAGSALFGIGLFVWSALQLLG